MSIWIRTICRKSVASITPEELLTGINKRLMLLTYLYGQDDYEDTVDKLRVENASSESTFQLYRIYYRKRGKTFIRVERWSKPNSVAEEVKELIASLEEYKTSAIETVRLLLDNALETIGFELKQTDASGMGWPVAMAAATYFAEIGEGLLYADGEGWFRPTEKEIEPLLTE